MKSKEEIIKDFKQVKKNVVKYLTDQVMGSENKEIEFQQGVWGDSASDGFSYIYNKIMYREKSKDVIAYYHHENDKDDLGYRILEYIDTDTLILMMDEI